MADNDLNALVRKLIARQRTMEAQNQQILGKYQDLITACENQPRSISQEIDSIPGRRIFYTLTGRTAFTAALAGLRGQPISYLVSQDGPFIATHYPMAVWKPAGPTNGTNFGRWSPVSSWPLPLQQDTVQDSIDLSYTVVDAGSQRNFQNEDVPPIFSRPDNLIPLPVPTLFAPNSSIQITPLFESIVFDATAGVPTTAGILTIAIPGYRIVNL